MKKVSAARQDFRAQKEIMTSENRSIYVDGQWCSNENGVMTFPLENQLEVQGQDMVATFDDFSLSGNISSVSPHCNRVYCLERSPKAPFNYLGQVLAREQLSDAPEVLTITATPDRHETLQQFTHTCELPSTHRNPGSGNTMVFYIDPSIDSDWYFDNLKDLVFTYEFSEYKS